MKLTPGTSISPGDTVTRQTLYDLFYNAAGDQVTQSDLSAAVQTITSQTDPPSAYPGKLWFDRGAQLLKVFVDVLEGTGCSVWLAIGPDRFDVPMYAEESLPFGAAVQLSGTGRGAKLPPDALTLKGMAFKDAIWESWKVVGFNQGGTEADGGRSTTPSGTWFACAIDGIVWTWRPVNIKYNTVWQSCSATLDQLDTLCSQNTDISGPSGYSSIRGCLVPGGYVNNQAKGNGIGIAQSLYGRGAYFADVPDKDRFWAKCIFTGARIGRI